MHPDLRELAVPFGDPAFASRARRGGQRRALDPWRRGDGGDLAEGRCEVDVAYGFDNLGGGDCGGWGGAPDERHPHQRIDVIRALEHQAEIALEFAVIGGEEDVGGLVPSALGDLPEHASAGFIDQFVFDVDKRVDLAYLVVGHAARDEGHRAAFIVAELPAVPFKPVARLLSEYRFDFVGRPRMARSEE